MKKTIIYNSVILFLYIFLYIWYLFMVKQGGMGDLGLIVTIIYMVIPFLSIIGGIIQRIFIKKLIPFILINYLLNFLLLYLITGNVGNIFIVSLIYAGITVVLSYTTRSVIVVFKRKK